VDLAFEASRGVTRAARRFEDGAAKARFSAPNETILINTAGGVAGGDEFRWKIAAGRGAHAAITTQACEKFYRSHGPPAHVATNLAAEAKARIDWLPQESILFDGARLNRTLEADLAPDARLLAVEAYVIGRLAMNETSVTGSIRERWRIRRDGRLVFADSLALAGSLTGHLDKPAVAAGGRALATVLLCAPDAEKFARRTRALLDVPNAGVSGFDGKLVARLVTADGYSLRRLLIPLLELLKESPLPKPWTL
jgi:urease accessory protein